MRKLLILTGVLILTGCKPEVYLGPLDSPIGNWKGMDSKYYFAGENVWEDNECFYSAISFYRDSLCCIEGRKGAFTWTYDESTLVADSTIWNVVELSGKLMALDYAGRLEKQAAEEGATDEENATDEPTVGEISEGAEDKTSDDETTGNEDTFTPVEYKGKTIKSDGSAYWYYDASGEMVPCFPKEYTAEDGTASLIWWDTRSDFYKPF